MVLVFLSSPIKEVGGSKKCHISNKKVGRSEGTIFSCTLFDILTLSLQIPPGELDFNFDGDFKTAWTFGTENAYPYQTSTFEAYSSRSIGFTLSYDTRDFWLNPTEGRYYSFNVKRGWKYTTVGTNFFKLGMDLNHYSPIVEKQQILASHIGAGIGFEDIPIGEKYWAGGANTIRGYYPSQARTGKRKFLFNIEYRLNFSDMFQGVFFYDWGNAWDTGAPDPADFISGWGPGVRINTPLGPIRLDYGVPGNGSFSEGIMHFSIGQAF